MSDASTLVALRDLVLKNFDVTPEQVDDHKPFNEMGLDSLDLADFVFKAEDAFGVVIDYERAMQAPTLTGFAALIETLRLETSPSAA